MMDIRDQFGNAVAMDISEAAPAAAKRETIEGLIRKIHRLRVENDLKILAQLFAIGAVYEIVGRRAHFDYAGVYQGRDEIMDVFRKIDDEVAVLQADVVDIMVEGNHAFARIAALLRHRATGVRAEHEVWDTWYFQDGLVAEGRKLMDTNAFDRMRKG